jgi:glycosyltransferase involved in cell wall biosynthesis
MKTEMNTYYFSVIIPLYNKVDYIERAIQSVLDQTHPFFEIIVVNDGSCDGGEKKVGLFKDDRIRLINQTNQGVSAARNNGAAHASFDYFAFLDSDDVWEKSFLEVINVMICDYPFAGIYGTNNYIKFPDGKMSFEKMDYLFNGAKSGIISNYLGLFAKNGRSPFFTSGHCIPRKIFEESGGFMKGVVLTEDSDLWCRIALKHDIAYSPSPLMTYYLEMSNNTVSKIPTTDYQVSMTLQNLLDTNEIKPMLQKSARQLIAFQQISLVKRAILTGNHQIALHKLKDKRIFREYPLKGLYLLPLALLPFGLFSKINKIMKKYT